MKPPSICVQLLYLAAAAAASICLVDCLHARSSGTPFTWGLPLVARGDAPPPNASSWALSAASKPNRGVVSRPLVPAFGVWRQRQQPIRWTMKRLRPQQHQRYLQQYHHPLTGISLQPQPSQRQITQTRPGATLSKPLLRRRSSDRGQGVMVRPLSLPAVGSLQMNAIPRGSVLEQQMNDLMQDPIKNMPALLTAGPRRTKGRARACPSTLCLWTDSTQSSGRNTTHMGLDLERPLISPTVFDLVGYPMAIKMSTSDRIYRWAIGWRDTLPDEDITGMPRPWTHKQSDVLQQCSSNIAAAAALFQQKQQHFCHSSGHSNGSSTSTTTAATAAAATTTAAASCSVESSAAEFPPHHRDPSPGPPEIPLEVELAAAGMWRGYVLEPGWTRHAEAIAECNKAQQWRREDAEAPSQSSKRKSKPAATSKKQEKQRTVELLRRTQDIVKAHWADIRKHPVYVRALVEGSTHAAAAAAAAASTPRTAAEIAMGKDIAQGLEMQETHDPHVQGQVGVLQLYRPLWTKRKYGEEFGGPPERKGEEEEGYDDEALTNPSVSLHWPYRGSRSSRGNNSSGNSSNSSGNSSSNSRSSSRMRSSLLAPLSSSPAVIPEKPTETHGTHRPPRSV
ncbi:hypothetical protein ACSSS7_006668 [Eimeria intestinalis]